MHRKYGGKYDGKQKKSSTLANKFNQAKEYYKNNKKLIISNTLLTGSICALVIMGKKYVDQQNTLKTQKDLLDKAEEIMTDLAEENKSLQNENEYQKQLIDKLMSDGLRHSSSLAGQVMVKKKLEKNSVN